MKQFLITAIRRSQGAATAISISVLCLAAFWQSPVQAQMYQADVDFEAADQSMWEAGDAGILDINYFIGPTWGDSCTDDGTCTAATFNRDDPLADSEGQIYSVTTPEITIPEVCLWGLGCTPSYTLVEAENIGSYGATIGYETAGQIGFDLNIDATSGDVDVNYGGSVDFEWPDTNEILGDTLTIDTAFTEGATSMATNFPEASLTLDFIFDILATLDFEACVALCAPLDVGIDVAATIPLLDIDTNNIAFETDLNLATLTARLPDLDTFTSGTNAAGNLVSEGTGLDPLLDVDLDLTAIASALFGLPDVLEQSVGFGGAYAYYNLLEVLAGIDVDIRQVFTFDPMLMVRLDAADGQSVSGEVGSSLDFNTFVAGDTLVTPTFNLSNLFTNTTFLDITPTFLLSLLEAGIGLDLPTLVNALGFNDPALEFPPFYTLEPGFNVLASIPVFSESWQIAFNPITRAGFNVTVPEPGTLALFGIGLVAIGATGRRRRRKAPAA